ncbi:DUF5107 domain-containing protein [Streptomyces sp. KR80]|uniref:DUF5107 domain-containing protein n=1 Tax=Streptomyces sp. KR80 TaxID=3457426 RepID=UPI003FD38BA6
MPTTVRRTVLTLPGVPFGRENPLAALQPLDALHSIDQRGDPRQDGAWGTSPPRWAAGEFPWIVDEHFRPGLPTRQFADDGHDPRPLDLDAIVVENDRLRATVLPGLGGRLHSLHHKPSGRELLDPGSVFRSATLAPNGAWFSGGLEWSVGPCGHAASSCAALHAARLPAPDGGEMLRLWEWERSCDTPFQVDIWLPDDADFLYVGVRIRNPHDRPVPVARWSTAAVPAAALLEAGAELSWLEAYGPLTAEPSAVHGGNWAAAHAEAETRLQQAPRRVDAAYTAWLPSVDDEPKESLATGSGWGALEVARAAYELPGTPFHESTLGDEQRPWLQLLLTGALPESGPANDPGTSLVSPAWRALLEEARPGASAEYHLGVAQWHAGDRAQAARSWQRSLSRAETQWALRCLAVADAESGAPDRAADRLLRAVRIVAAQSGANADTDTRSGAGAAPERPDAGHPDRILAVLGHEAMAALLACGRTAEARDVLESMPPGIRERGRFQLLRAQLLLAQDDAPAARAVFDAGFAMADLPAGGEALEETWYAVAERLVAGDGPVTSEAQVRARAEHPLPRRYDYRDRPAG